MTERQFDRLEFGTKVHPKIGAHKGTTCRVVEKNKKKKNRSRTPRRYDSCIYG